MESFSLKIHFGGDFFGESRLVYVGGKVECIDVVSHENVSLAELCKMAKGKGVYQTDPYIFFKIPQAKNGKLQLKLIKSDDDVFDMCILGCTSKRKLIKLYMVPHDSDFVINCIWLEVNECRDMVVVDGNEGSGRNDDESEYRVENDSMQVVNKEGDDDNMHDSEYDLSEDEGRSEEVKLDLDAAMKGAFGIEYGEDIPIEDNDSDYLSDCSLESKSSDSDSDSEDEGIKKQRLKRFQAAVDMADPKFEVEMVFSSVQELRNAINAHAIRRCKQIKFEKNDKDRVRAKCAGKRCQWKLYAKHIQENDSFQIRELYGIHKCGNHLFHRHLTSKRLARIYLNDFRLNQWSKVCDFKTKVSKDFGINISRTKVYNTYKFAREMILGHLSDQYKLLWNYREELLRSNPGSTVVLETAYDRDVRQDRFLRFYVCLDALRKGFLEGCNFIVGKCNLA